MGVIGHPISHSLSPQMHNASFDSKGIDYAYVAMDVAPARLGEAVRGLAALGFRGFNVTIPHKEEILRFLDELDESAGRTGAVNTVVLEDGSARGYNTDGFGFLESCREAGVMLAGENVLILGAGGAAAAIADAVLCAGAEAVAISNRTAGRARILAERLLAAHPGAQVSAGGLGELDDLYAWAGVLVNTTPVGMRGEDPLPFPASAVQGKVVCDIVYRSRGDTPLLETAQRLGSRVVRGRRMLLYQGVQAQRLWTGIEPDVEVMGRALEEGNEDPDSRG